MRERTPLMMDDVFQDITVPDLGCALLELKEAKAKDHDLFAVHQQKAWDKTVEARCDFSRKVRLTRRSSIFFISLWQKSVFGRTLTDIKSDDGMVGYFADELSPLIQDILGADLGKGGWSIITTPKRRHTTKNFATRISEQIAAKLRIPFYEDVCSCHSKQRLNAVFTVNVVPKEHNVICFDDFVTTGQTLLSMKNALMPFGKNLVFFAGINNKL